MVKEDSPWQTGNYPGEHQAKLVTPEVAAKLIKKAKRPLFVGGSLLLGDLNGKPLIDYAMEIAKASKMPVVAVAHTKKKFLENGFHPTASMPVINLVDRLKDPEWKGVKGEGQHDLVVFMGVLYYMGSQGLSTLKHFAPHLTTITICRFFHPNANFSFGNMDDKKWTESLNTLIKNLKGG
jgi:acetyl-CoA decarbonylase/synthase complex subunit epsilon